METVKEISMKEAATWRLLCDYKEVCEGRGTEEEKAKLLEQYMMEEVIFPVDRDAFFRKTDTLNGEISEKMEKIRETMIHMDGSCRRAAYHFLVAADGTRLMNQLAAVVLDWYYKENHYSPTEKKCLAEELENWLYYYKDMWRKSSKESELHRIEGQICWYADELRRI